jgi:hypothetical protein
MSAGTYQAAGHVLARRRVMTARVPVVEEGGRYHVRVFALRWHLVVRSSSPAPHLVRLHGVYDAILAAAA